MITQAPWESTDAIHCDDIGMGISQIQGEYQTSDPAKCAVSPSQSGVNVCTGSCMRSATHSRTQHAFDSIHTTHLLFSSAYMISVHVRSISDKAVGVCVCADGKISRLHTHLSILLV